MICPECIGSMQETEPDAWKCPACNFEAQQLSIWELVELREFNKAMPNYKQIVTYSMSEADKAALEAREREKRQRDKGVDFYTTAPQQGYLGGRKYRRTGGEK